jgi:hypothetical protein
VSGYDLLTAAEQDTYDEYCRLRQISDWPGFDSNQQTRKDEAGQWIAGRRDYIKRLAEGEVEGQQPGWDTANRRERYDYLATTSSGSPHRLCQLPTDGGTDAEKSYITEREVWWRIQTDYDEQKTRKQACTDWLTAQRQYVWQCAEGKVDGIDGGWNINNRQQRYANLQVATKYGSGYEDWCEEYDQTTGEPLKPADSGGGGSSSGNWRDQVARWQEDHLGLTESPADSNCDSRSDGICNAQDTCANGTWLRYQPWCGVWAFMGLYAAGLVQSGDESGMASVASIEDYAKQAKGPFRGWTTDGSKAAQGDLVILFGRGQHVGTVRSIDSGYAYTWEGNTSSGSGGSQSNGGGSYKRSRSRNGETYGYALVRGD